MITAILAYYVVHEGAHLLYALCIGVFKQINFIGLGIQIDVYIDKMTFGEMGIFCLLGSVTTLVVAYVLVAIIDVLAKNSSKVFKACMYYITISMLVIDPLYLSVLCGFFGGGDMNGISSFIPEILARIVYGCILVVNIIIFFKVVLPKYKIAFDNQ
ncbi:MAG: hypothetical protein IKY94_13055 [Lachnospiraceae bacterium]|nr:hypothetical protein [Lachnospiraceae bacterium]